jgi:hypothetical protein
MNPYPMRVLVAPGVIAPDDRTPAEIDATARLLDAAALAEDRFGADDLEAWACTQAAGRGTP